MGRKTGGPTGSDGEVTEAMLRFPLGAAEDVFDETSETGPLLRAPMENEDAVVPVLRVISGVDLMAYAVIAPDEQIVIGRRTERDDPERRAFRLADTTVSRRHTRITSDGTGQLTLIDLGSKNGTAVNGSRSMRTALQPGDNLELGRTALVLELLSRADVAHLAIMAARRADPAFEVGTGLCAFGTPAGVAASLGSQPGASAVVEDPLVVVAVLRLDGRSALLKTHGEAIVKKIDTAVGRLVLHGMGPERVVGRVGDAIVAIVPKLGEARALQLTNGVRRTVMRHPWGRVSAGLEVSISGAVAQRREEESLTDLVERVHRAGETVATGTLVGLSRRD